MGLQSLRRLSGRRQGQGLRVDTSRDRGSAEMSAAMRTKHLGCWIVIVTVAAVLIFIEIANAHDANHGAVSDPAIQQWYRHLMQPDNPTASCCGEADAYWADEIHVRN